MARIRVRRPLLALRTRCGRRADWNRDALDSASGRSRRRGFVTVRYRIALPPAEPGCARRGSRSSGRPVASLVDRIPSCTCWRRGQSRERHARAALSWRIATGLNRTNSPRTSPRRTRQRSSFPILAGQLREWRFVEGGVPHRVSTGRCRTRHPSTRGVRRGIQRTVHQAIALFGRAPYREYTFMFEDGAWGGDSSTALR